MISVVATTVALLMVAAPATDLEWGTAGDGRAKDAWTKAIAKHLGKSQAEILAAESMPLNAQQMAWAGLFMKGLAPFKAARAKLDRPFSHTPGRVRLLLGNRGERDAFTYRDDVIAINLARWQEAYGDAGPEQAERVQRILAHEYTHLLTRRYKRERRLVTTTAFDRVLWTLFHEGLGNYRSLPARYRPLAAGKPSKDASIALTKHGEKLVTAFNALSARPSKDEEAVITQGMVEGTFADRVVKDNWGALPVALWIAHEVSLGKSEDVVLRRIVRAGPSGILTLARRNLPSDLAARLPGVRARVKAPSMKAIESPKERSGFDALKR